MQDAPESILNVDDYGPGRYARTKVLQQAGFSVMEASTGMQTLEILANHKPEVILLDVNLPDMSGFDVCREIRRNPETNAITVLHISASSVHNHHQVNGLEAGADSYLVEPVDPSVLVATIRAFLRTRKAENALRRSNEELAWFAYRAAHDLNEPLRTITAHTQLLERDLKGQLNPRATKSMEFVLKAAQRMAAFIESLLRVATVTHGTRHFAALDCEAMLTRVLANLEAAIRDSGASVTHDALPTVTADGGIEEVFQNLIANSIKYHREDVPPEIHLSVRPEKGMWIFSVRDNGIGIEPEDRKTIFNMFRRLHGGDIPGNGLGLALCQKIIEAHRGSIWVESQADTGSTFYFTLPQNPTPSPA